MRTGLHNCCMLGLFFACTSNAIAQRSSLDPVSHADANAQVKEKAIDSPRSLFLDQDGNLFDGNGKNSGRSLNPTELIGQSIKITAHPKADVNRVTKLFNVLDAKLLSVTVSSNVPNWKANNFAKTSLAESSAELQTNVLYLKHLAVSDAERIVKEIVSNGNSIRIAADARLNAMIIRSSEGQLKEIKDLIEKIDKAPKPENTASTAWSGFGSKGQQNSVYPKRAPGSFDSYPNYGTHPYRQHETVFRELEARAQQMAQEIRGGSVQNEKIQNDLKISVGAAFDARLEAQRNELQGAKERIASVEAKLKRRQEQRDAIVDRRVQQLLSTDFSNNQKQRLTQRRKITQTNPNRRVERSLAEYDLQLATLKREKAQAAFQEAQKLRDQNAISSSEISRLEFEAKEAAIMEKRAKAVFESYSEKKSVTSFSNPLRETQTANPKLEPATPQETSK